MFIFKGRIHHFGKKFIFASVGNSIFSSSNNGKTWDRLFTLPVSGFGRIQHSCNLSRRFFRAGIHHIASVGKSGLVVIANRLIYQYDLNKRAPIYEEVQIAGSRPLFLCHNNIDRLYYGQYCGNPNREPIHLYCCDWYHHSWKIACTFDSVRHIHGVFFDPYEKAIWVTTGDTDREAAIWKTKDQFASLERVVSGSQQARVVQLLFTKEYVYFGSDTPLEKNYLYRLHRENGNIETLQEVGNSVFWGCKVQDMLFFSTAIEPSDVNRTKSASVWGSKNGKDWQCVLNFKKDIWPMKLFQYGQVLFPSGFNQTEYLWYTPFATTGDQVSFRVRAADLFQEKKGFVTK